MVRVNNRSAFYSVHEAAELFRVSPVTVRRAIRDNRLPAIRIRKRYVVPAPAVQQLVKHIAESDEGIDLADVLAPRCGDRQGVCAPVVAELGRTLGGGERR